MTIVPRDALSQSKNVHLQQSKLQEKVAWVVTGTVPIITAAGYLTKEKPTNAYFTIPHRTTGLIAGGFVAVMGSLLFIASAKNKKKAASLSIRNRTARLLANENDYFFVITFVPTYIVDERGRYGLMNCSS